jgi:NhaP-type Na+/H+ or K+/H+ antiporter
LNVEGRNASDNISVMNVIILMQICFPHSPPHSFDFDYICFVFITPILMSGCKQIKRSHLSLPETGSITTN